MPTKCTATVGVYARGPKGDIGPVGDVTPAAEAARDAAIFAQMSAATSLIEAQKAAVVALNYEEIVLESASVASTNAATASTAATTALAQVSLVTTKAQEAAASESAATAAATAALSHRNVAESSAQSALASKGVAEASAASTLALFGSAQAVQDAVDLSAEKAAEAQGYWQNIEDRVTVPLIQMAASLLTTQALIVSNS